MKLYLKNYCTPKMNPKGPWIDLGEQPWFVPGFEFDPTDLGFPLIKTKILINTNNLQLLTAGEND